MIPASSTPLAFAPDSADASRVRIRRVFSVPPSAQARIDAWLEVKKQETLELQRKAMSPREFDGLTCGGKYPYLGAIGGGTTYTFLPTAKPDVYAVEVGYAFLQETLVVEPDWPANMREVPGAFGNLSHDDYALDISVKDFEEWTANFAAVLKGSPWSEVSVSFTPTGLGPATTLRHLPTSLEGNFTDYENW